MIYQILNILNGKTLVEMTALCAIVIKFLYSVILVDVPHGQDTVGEGQITAYQKQNSR